MAGRGTTKSQDSPATRKREGMKRMRVAEVQHTRRRPANIRIARAGAGAASRRLLACTKVPGAPNLGVVNAAWILLGALAWTAPVVFRSPAAEPPPARIIFDTDMAEDVDDVGALALLHALADAGEAEILAVMVCARNESVVPCVDAINTWYGRPDLPIGYQRGLRIGYGVPDVRDLPSRYTEDVAAAFPHDLRRGSDAPDAARLYRQILAAQPDASVTLVSVGFLNNLKDLLDSRPDSLSPLDGEALVRRKVRLWSCMGGMFPNGRFENGDGEYNVCRDTVASIRALHDWPTPIVFSGFEIGVRIKTGARLRDLAGPHPVRLAYERYNGLQPRESWDQTAVLFAVRGLREDWTLSEPGLCLMHNRIPFGFNEWIPTASGRHRYLREKRPPGDIAREIEELMIRPPQRRP